MLDSNGGLSTGSLVLFIVGTIAIVTLAYYVTYLISKGATKGAQSRAIKVLDSRALSKDKLICVIEVAGKAYLVAMSDGGISLLDTLSQEAADQLRAGSGQMMPAFTGVIQKGLGKAFEAVLEKRRQQAGTSPARKPPEKESAEEENPPLQRAAEADDLDEMYRKLQKRREKKDTPPQGGPES